MTGQAYKTGRWHVTRRRTITETTIGLAALTLIVAGSIALYAGCTP